jgi:hypothetical protein
LANLGLRKDGGSDVTGYDVSVKSSDTSWSALYAPEVVVHTAIGGKMDRFDRSAAMRLLVALISCGLAVAQNATQQETSKPFSIRATHLLGFENAKGNCRGTLSIEDDFLQFQQAGKPREHIKIVSVRDIVLGEESRQVGGLPMTLGKAVAPYGGGRVVSLFAHKKYDILTLDYVDSDGGIHGAIFQLVKGQADVVKHELTARGAVVGFREDQSKPSASEAGHETE